MRSRMREMRLPASSVGSVPPQTEGRGGPFGELEALLRIGPLSRG